jgi:hypothetical protein
LSPDVLYCVFSSRRIDPGKPQPFNEENEGWLEEKKLDRKHCG